MKNWVIKPTFDRHGISIFDQQLSGRGRSPHAPPVVHLLGQGA